MMVKRMRASRWALCVTSAAIACLAQSAQAAISCNSATATSISGTTPTSGNLDLVGTITVTCTRQPSDPTSQTIYIGVNAGENPDGTAGRELTRQTGTQQMNYAIYRNAGFTGGWSEGGGRPPGSAQGGGLQVAVNFSSTTTTAQGFNFPYYVRVTNGNYSGTGQPPGIYDDLVIRARVRLDNRNGVIQADAFFGVTVSKPSHCYFSSPPNTLTMNYVSFSPTPQSGSTNFSVSCTATTSYTMSLDATSGTLLGLNYALSLSNSSGVGSGFAQTYSVNGSMPAGQVGTCTAANCTATQPRVITITY
jgi:spore coat protein U-like protein